MAAPRYAPRRIGHVNLFVSKCDQMCSFLTDVCGFEMTGLMSKSGSAFFSNGNTHHDIGFIELEGYRRFKAARPYIQEPASRGTSVGLNHFGWEMEHEKALVDAYRRTLDGGEFPVPRITNNGTAYSNYIFDVEGVQHQLYADNLKDWRSVYTGGEVSLHRPPDWEPGASDPSTARNFDITPEIRRVEHAPLHPQRLSHATLSSRFFDDVLAFYDRFLGLKRHPAQNESIAYLSGHASNLDLILVDSATASGPPGLKMVTFDVWPEDDLTKAHFDLQALGYSDATYLSLPHKTSVFLTTPDGILFEFTQNTGHGRANIQSLANPDDLLTL
jgi:catechol 2,3-dioxygenase